MADPSATVSNTVTLERPPKSKRYEQFREIDRAEFMDLETAKHRINPAQAIWIEELEQRLARDSGDRPSPS